MAERATVNREVEGSMPSGTGCTTLTFNAIPGMTVYDTPGGNIFDIGFLLPGAAYCGGVVYTVPPVIKGVYTPGDKVGSR